MDPKIAFGFAAVFFELLSMFFYYRGMFRGETKPHLYTFVTWSLVLTIIFLGQVVAGAGPGAWVTGISAMLVIPITVLCLRFGTKDITRIDAIFLAGSLLSIGLWLATNDPMLAVVLASVIDALAIIPTMRKTWHAPNSEPLISWLLADAKVIFALLAISTYSVTTWIYPAQVLLMNSILIIIIVFRRSAGSKP